MASTCGSSKRVKATTSCSYRGWPTRGHAGSIRSRVWGTATGSRRSTTEEWDGHRRPRARSGSLTSRPTRQRSSMNSGSTGPTWSDRRWGAPSPRSWRSRIPTVSAASSSTGPGAAATASSTRSSATGCGRRRRPTRSATSSSRSTCGASRRGSGTRASWMAGSTPPRRVRTLSPSTPSAVRPKR